MSSYYVASTEISVRHTSVDKSASFLEEPLVYVHSSLYNSVQNAAAEVRSKYYETTEEEGGKFCLLDKGESEVASWEREHSSLEKSENHECVNKVILVVLKKKLDWLVLIKRVIVRATVVSRNPRWI